MHQFLNTRERVFAQSSGLKSDWVELERLGGLGVTGLGRSEKNSLCKGTGASVHRVLTVMSCEIRDKWENMKI